jgi:hypothetical protein
MLCVPVFITHSYTILRGLQSASELNRLSDRQHIAIIVQNVCLHIWNQHIASRNKKQTPWPLVRKRIIPTERQPLVDEI